MWLFTTIGFFSAVQKSGTDFITIRARVKNDLNNLRSNYLPDLSETIGHAGTDYPWRATVPHDKFAVALGEIAKDIDYPNFKNEIAAKQGKARASKYGKVWSVLYELPEQEASASVTPKPAWTETVPAGKKVAYGGVIFSKSGRVLLREVKNHFDGYVWTFPKGKAELGETPEETALRETYEETGARPLIIAPIAGDFVGGTSINRYYLMKAEEGDGGVTADDEETASICWVLPDEARRLISQTTNQVGKKRDIAVLDAAIVVFMQSILNNPPLLTKEKQHE
jgi:8-oxo-dGTP pyrophosphatase MutT (NUDIX family)